MVQAHQNTILYLQLERETYLCAEYFLRKGNDVSAAFCRKRKETVDNSDANLLQ